jgi:hypothetical protein
VRIGRAEPRQQPAQQTCPKQDPDAHGGDV